VGEKRVKCSILRSSAQASPKKTQPKKKEKRRNTRKGTRGHLNSKEGENYSRCKKRMGDLRKPPKGGGGRAAEMVQEGYVLLG